MDIRQYIKQAQAYGTSEGAEKGWETRGHNPATFRDQTHMLREGELWHSSGLQKTGTKAANDAVAKAKYFADSRGFKPVASESSEAPRSGYYAGKILTEQYEHPTGARMTITHDTGKNRVYADISGPPEAHEDFAKTISKKGLRNEMYQYALKQWMTDPRRVGMTVGEKK